MARSFNGSTDKITLSANPLSGQSSSTPAFTMAAWFKPASLVGAQAILYLGSAAQNNFVQLEFRGDQTGHPVAGNIFNGTNNPFPLSTTGVSATGVWHHACMICYSVSSWAAFIDGGSKGTSVVTANGLNFSTWDTFLIGFFDKFNGSVAELCVWNNSLSDQEVAALGTGINARYIRPTSIAGYWPLWGLSSSEPEMSGQKNTGTLTGTAQTNHAPVTLWTPKSRTAPLIQQAVVGVKNLPPFQRFAA